MSAEARHACISAVSECLRGEDLQATLNRSLTRAGLSEADKKLVSKISYGYLRHKTRIDFLLSRMVKGKLKKLPFSLVLRLGLAVFELHHLERVPEYATVHWYVEEVKKVFSPRMGKLANAVLREVLRWGEAVHDPQFYWHGTKDRATFLARFYSCPGWIVRLWRNAYGDEACQGLLVDSLRQPHTGIRVNRNLAGAEELYASLAEEAEQTLPREWGLALGGPSSLSLSDLESAGRISRQSLAAQLVLAELGPSSSSSPIWDACAGRGGKTGALLEYTSGPVWASDISHEKIRGLQWEIYRLQSAPVPAFVHDAAASPCLRRCPRTILLDAPCSGLGVLSRRPDIKHKRTPKEVERLTRIQQGILNSCLEGLPPEGRMIYVTCTVNPEENEKGVKRFVADAGGKVQLCRAFCPTVPELNEFFYAALLRRSSPSG